MKRDEEFRTPIGQAGWHFYQDWMKAYRRQVPRSSAFLSSKFYASFIRFAKFVKKVNLPDPQSFILLMKERDIAPSIWNSDAVYAIFLEFLDRRGDPKKQAKTTIGTLYDVAEEMECDVSEVFDHITSSHLIQLLRERRLSPWILLNSEKFQQFYVNKVSPEERIIMRSIIRPHYWAEKFQARPDDRGLMRTFVSKLNL